MSQEYGYIKEEFTYFSNYQVIPWNIVTMLWQLGGILP